MMHTMRNTGLVLWALEHISEPIREISAKDGTVRIYLCDGRVGVLYMGADGPCAALPS